MRVAFSTLFCSTLALLLASTAVIAAPQSALTVYGEPAKYQPGFTHFDYANPNAPKGGSLRRSAIEIGRYDHVLPYGDKGIGVSQVDGWLYSPLAQRPCACTASICIPSLKSTPRRSCLRCLSIG